ncbi:hypothetical protein CSC62_08705 [Pseudoxanthomonas jiangsuensis]|uniref:hypothetical protein n=1 Tax=Pseudoxanthomonas jiangsuensis TaxID=619688 RepID=UPI0013912800|nr:hypothetical protein [Pseudoxanthomonas jiangsuensis]KAF1697271.1 hypothetical protein CSC62_08705 [Pseudoxanthomonas jiangsuensis]
MSVTLFVLDLAEFRPLVDAAANVASVTVRQPVRGYWRIQAERRISFSRKELRLRRPLWNSALAGGFCGKLVEYTDDVMTLESEG